MQKEKKGALECGGGFSQMQKEKKGGLECGGGFSQGQERRIGAKVVQEGWGG
jgi:hypothetical protein